MSAGFPLAGFDPLQPIPELLPMPEFLRRQVEATDRLLAEGEWTEHATTDEAIAAIAARRGLVDP